MNNLIKKQLSKCRIAQIPQYDDDTIEIYIPKSVDISGAEVELHNCYLIELENYIVNPPETFNLHENWNNNIKPTVKCYKCEIIQIMGKMIRINGIGYDYENKIDLDCVWTGWLPRKGFKVLKRL